ncbi:RNA polymerase sigma factor FliA [Aestuariirhabdus litorea]|uniref:RNA polymerase sigma factor FliA n=1 Tax=Aestuariirhabdus litorea TaxID=2528527 RepID=A0A3P3VU21_9GAMM|nr:RNA polymerase sigma factor FliA [Aestuariirhabdus litorea]RRJ85478.1 RNA polymerase sigma factor FliA [Aestuariirhabdus litorea]RWW98205.1 FliA/WhiG family RNA polymerase sigma factor [Endozoicomonadaceae bacterium GTF-13]
MYTNNQAESLNVLVERHAPLVKRIAHHLAARLPSSVQVDDLIQSGMIGLLESARKYDGSKGAAFETYAGIRIRGAMLDEIRKGDWVPRSVHRNSRRVSEAVKAVEARLGRDAKDNEIAAELQVSVGEYHAMLHDSMGGHLFSFDDLIDSDDTQQEAALASLDVSLPHEGVMADRFRESLAEAISTLPDREQLLLSLYYDEELNLKEIGAVLGVSESRVSQLHSQSALRLRSRLKGWSSDSE